MSKNKSYFMSDDMDAHIFRLSRVVLFLNLTKVM